MHKSAMLMLYRDQCGRVDMPEELQGDELSQGYGPPKPIPYVPYASSPQLPGVPSYIGSGEANALPPVPPVLSSPPQASIVSASSSVQKKSGQGRWITITILAQFLLPPLPPFLFLQSLRPSTPAK